MKNTHENIVSIDSDKNKSLLNNFPYIYIYILFYSYYFSDSTCDP